MMVKTMANKTIQKITLVAASLVLGAGIVANPMAASANTPIVSCAINYVSGQENQELSHINDVRNATKNQINNGASMVRGNINAQNQARQAGMNAAQDIAGRFGGKFSNIANIFSDIVRQGSNIQAQQNNRAISNERRNMDDQVDTVINAALNNVRQVRNNERNALRYLERGYSNPRSEVNRIERTANGDVRVILVRAQRTLANEGIRLTNPLLQQNINSNFCSSL